MTLKQWLEERNLSSSRHLTGITDCSVLLHRAAFQYSSSSRMRVINHNWSATKQHLHPQSVAEINRHSVLSGDKIQQCERSSGSRHKNTDQCL